MPHQKSGEFYLVVSEKKRGWSTLTGRLTNSKPKSLTKGEIAIKLNVSLPSALFEEPQFQATIRVPEGSVTPQIVDASVLDNIKDTIEQQTGVSITLNVVDNREEV